MTAILGHWEPDRLVDRVARAYGCPFILQSLILMYSQGNQTPHRYRKYSVCQVIGVTELETRMGQLHRGKGGTGLKRILPDATIDQLPVLLHAASGSVICSKSGWYNILPHVQLHSWWYLHNQASVFYYTPGEGRSTQVRVIQVT